MPLWSVFYILHLPYKHIDKKDSAMATVLPNGTILETNLLLHQRKNFKPDEPHPFRFRGLEDINDPTSPIVTRSIGHWVKNADGSPVSALPVEDAILIARSLNKKRNFIPKNTPISSIRIHSGSLTFHGKQFNAQRINRLEGKKPSSKFKENLSTVMRFCEQLDHIPPAKLTFKQVSDWWWNEGEFRGEKYYKSGNVHANKKSIMKRFFAHLRQFRIVSVEEFIDNPFNTRHSDTPIGLKTKPKKLTKRLTPAQFKAIRKAADQAGAYWVVNAMDIGITTGMRIGDICSLRFDKHMVGNEIRAHFSKTGEEGDEGTVHILIPLDKHRKVLAAVNQCQQTRSGCLKKGDQKPSPYFIHKKYSCVKKSEEKSHYTQVLSHHFSEEFKKYRDIAIAKDAIKSEDKRVFTKLKKGERHPGFHQIRSLFARTRLLAGIDRELTQQFMGHKESEMTEHYDSTGYEIDWLEAPEPMTDKVFKAGGF